MKLSSAKAIARNTPDSTAEPSADLAPIARERTRADNKKQPNYLRAQMIVETLTPFLAVLIDLQPDRLLSK